MLTVPHKGGDETEEAHEQKVKPVIDQMYGVLGVALGIGPASFPPLLPVHKARHK